MFAAFAPKSRVRSRERERTSTSDEAASCCGMLSSSPDEPSAAVVTTSGGPGRLGLAVCGPRRRSRRGSAGERPRAPGEGWG
eukprot:scaffold65766_cov51-Phaeocystis_antarctica.AAC.3